MFNIHKHITVFGEKMMNKKPAFLAKIDKLSIVCRLLQAKDHHVQRSCVPHLSHRQQNKKPSQLGLDFGSV
jgi:hypothetical protein